MGRISLPNIFWVFFQIGATTLGGGYALVTQVMNAMEKRGWVSSKDFHEILATAQLVPGAVGINTPVLVGNHLRGTPGAVVALIGTIMGPFVFILATSSFLPGLETSPLAQNILAAVRPAVSGLIFAAGWHIWKQRPPDAWEWVVLALMLLFLVALRMDPIPVLGIGLVAGFLAKRLAGIHR